MTAIIWSKPSCSFCEQAKTFLKMKGIEFEEKKIGAGYTKEDLLEEVPSARSVPQIFINGELIGGYHELKTRLNG